MSVYVFATYGATNTYLVAAETATEAKGKAWDADLDAEFIGEVEAVVADADDPVVEPSPS